MFLFKINYSIKLRNSLESIRNFSMPSTDQADLTHYHNCNNQRRLSYLLSDIYIIIK